MGMNSLHDMCVCGIVVSHTTGLLGTWCCCCIPAVVSQSTGTAGSKFEQADFVDVELTPVTIVSAAPNLHEGDKVVVGLRMSVVVASGCWWLLVVC